MSSALRSFSPNRALSKTSLDQSEEFSVYYHNLFKYPLTFSEIIKWRAGDSPKINAKVLCKNGYYFIDGSEGLIYRREIRKRISRKKKEIAQRASRLLSAVPSIKMVGISGSLAMENSGKNDDIDLLIITRKGKLWFTRIISYLLLKTFGFSLRTPGDPNQKDKLCLNVWLDESDLEWSKKERNFYTAHEILQTTPLINKEKTHELFLAKNSWVLDFWPNVNDVNIKNTKYLSKIIKPGLIEKFAYKLQLNYMKPKITKEVIKPTKAIFHPVNLSKNILSKILVDNKAKISLK